MTIIAVFKSRAQALDCAMELRKGGVPSQSVSNPPEARVGCGISVRFEENFLLRARRIIAAKAYTAFAGYMKRAGNRYVPL